MIYDMDALKRELRRDEGERLMPYRDSLGYWTVGVGHLLTGNELERFVDQATGKPRKTLTDAECADPRARDDPHLPHALGGALGGARQLLPMRHGPGTPDRAPRRRGQPGTQGHDPALLDRRPADRSAGRHGDGPPCSGHAVRRAGLIPPRPRPSGIRGRASCPNGSLRGSASRPRQFQFGGILPFSIPPNSRESNRTARLTPAPAPAACPKPPPLFPVGAGSGSGEDSPTVAPRARTFPRSEPVRPRTAPRAPGGSAAPPESGRPGRSNTVWFPMRGAHVSGSRAMI